MKRVIALLSPVVVPMMVFTQTGGKDDGNVRGIDRAQLAGANIVVVGTFFLYLKCLT